MSQTIEILEARGRRVVLQEELARLYGVTVRALTQQVRRNRERFPVDFAFRLTKEEMRLLLPEIAAARSGWGGSRTAPLAFTQEGAAMLSSVLRSRRAVQANIAIMRAFVKMRELRAQNRLVLEKLDRLEKRVGRAETDIGDLIDAIRQDVLLPNRARIGFRDA